MDVPAGFRTNSAHTKQYLLYTPPRKSANIQPCETDSASHDNITIDQLSTTPLHSNCSLDLGLLSNTDPVSDTSTVPFIPIIRSVDKPSSSLPKNISMSEDYLRSCVGFHRIDTLKKHLLQLYQPTVTLDHTPPDAILDPGCYATLWKKDRTTIPVPRPSKFGEVVRIDIVFGPEVSICNLHYGLLCVD